MTTQGVKRPPRRHNRCTEFQLYRGEALPANVIDLTERRLVHLAAAATDAQQKLVLMALIVDYRAGHVAVAWRGGRPVPLRVAPEA